MKDVGFPGAAVPAVSGLKDAGFNADASDVIVFGDNDIADLPATHLATIARYQQEVAIEKLMAAARIAPIHKGRTWDFCAIDDGTSISFFAETFWENQIGSWISCLNNLSKSYSTGLIWGNG